MKWNATIKKIGDKAVDVKDKMVILFGVGANLALENVSIIQEFSKETPSASFVFKKGDTITINGITYVADYVGAMVESNIKALGHATLFFNQPLPKTPLANAIYFAQDEEAELPEFNVDDEIVYEHR